MKNLDLNGFGVQEMDAKVMEGTNGGFWQYIGGMIVSGLVGELVTEGIGQCFRDFSKGFNNH